MGENGDFKHSEAEKKAAARRIAEHLGPDTHKAGALADDDTAKVTGRKASELADWAIASGLSHRHGDWERHARQLNNRLQQEHTGLASANRLIQENDLSTGSNFGGPHPTPQVNLTNPKGGSLPRSKLDDL